MQTFRATARSPVRADPAGGGTDAPPFCSDHGGAVVNFGVARYVTATVQKLRPGSGIIVYSMDAQQGVVAEHPSEIVREQSTEFVTAFVKRLVPEEDSLILITDSDVPRGSGLGGSGALGVAIVAALDLAYGRSRSTEEIAALGNEVERVDLGCPGGSQDSFGAALGGLNLLEYHRGGGMSHRRLNVSENTRFSLEQRSLLIFTGASHVSGSVHEDIKTSYAQKESKTLEAMLALREQAFVMAKALESDDLDGYSTALDESCRRLYQLHAGCDSPEHRRMLNEIRDCIDGGKTCGAGGGGFMLVITKPGRRHDCIRKVEELGGTAWPLVIDYRGVMSWQEPLLTDDQIEQIQKFAAASVYS